MGTEGDEIEPTDDPGYQGIKCNDHFPKSDHLGRQPYTYLTLLKEKSKKFQRSRG